MAILRSRAYIRLLVVAAILGAPISAAAYGFLALVNGLQQELFTHLPHGLGLSTVPAWWPLPMLVIGGVLAGLAIRYLPGNGGASPAPGFGVHPPPAPVQLPGVILAALASLAFGAVIGPEMPLIALGGGLAVLATKAARRRPIPPQGVTVLGASGALFLGTAGGVAMSHLPGLPLVAAVAMGIGAMMAATTKLPLTSVLIASLLLLSDAVPVTPLVIVAVVIAYVAVAHIEPRLAARLAGSEHASSGAQADKPAEA